MKSDSDGAAGVLGCVAIIPVAVIGYMLRAWAIVTLWTWFVFPMWHVAIPSNKAAVGLAVLIGALSPHEASSESSKDESAYVTFATACIKILIYPVGSVLVGWCVKEWM